MGKETKEQQKKRDAARMKTQSAKGHLYYKKHPEKARERMRKIRAENGRNDGLFAQGIDEQRDPLNIASNNIIVASDFHIPFHNLALLERIFQVAEDHGVEDFCCPGDFWDCDNYSSFTPLTPLKVTFQNEVEHVREVLDLLTVAFKRVYFCRGNHERRWINLNGGKMNMKMLFGLTEITRGYKTTTDDHIYLNQNGESWLLCHPRNYRITPLSVARDLAAKHHCHVAMAHGHHFNQGWDRSGIFRVIDLGGLFDINSLEYARETSCHPLQRSGFYLLQDNIPHPYEPDHKGKVRQ